MKVKVSGITPEKKWRELGSIEASTKDDMATLLTLLTVGARQAGAIIKVDKSELPPVMPSPN